MTCFSLEVFKAVVLLLYSPLIT